MKSWIKSGITKGIPVDLVEERQEGTGRMAVWQGSKPACSES